VLCLGLIITVHFNEDICELSLICWDEKVRLG
jgi:hypothetical protein